MKIRQKVRHAVQLMTTVFANGYIIGFGKGTIFNGKSKAVCVPFLNCYSCPGAVASCPIGSLQAVLGSHKFHVSFYVLGLLMLFGVLFGRLICGFLCPFGLLQGVLHKIPVPKINVPKKLDGILRYLKYVILIVLVVVLPIVLNNEYGMAQPYFCKWICPAGTLEGGIPLLIKHESLRSVVGFLFGWKMAILILVIVLSMLIYRPFCKYLCPLGAFYAFFNKISFCRMQVDKEKCIDCKACEKLCPMQVEVTKEINSAECIRCGKCQQICEVDAIELKI